MTLQKPRMRFFLTTLILFQMSCSDVGLVKNQNSLLSVNTQLGGTLCSQPPLSSNTPMNTIFIIDMSFSNVGTIDNSGNFNQSVATDPQALRMTKAISYINNCAAATGNNYAIIPFANSVLNNDSSNTRCTAFEGKTQAVSDLNELITEQNAAVAAPVGVMTTTYYTSALTCLDTLIRSDISNSNAVALKNKFYQVFFLTDGAPSTQTGSVIPTSDANQFASEIQATALLAREAAGGFLLQTVYYGNVDFSTAQLFLNPMSQAGGTAATIKLDDLTGINFCTLAQSPIRVAYNITQFAVINLTALMQNGVLLPDSDADGIPDILDSAPTNRRQTAGLLDSVCQILGPACATFQSTGCSSQFDPFFGLSGCDLQAMGLNGTIDQDGDGIPDAIEILKGSLPLTFDADHDDGDGLTLIEKIRKGRQVYFKEGNIPYSITMDAETTPTKSSTCQAGTSAWSFSVANNPLVPTLAYHSTNSAEDQFVGHDALENVILVYFFAEPVNSTLLGTQVFAANTLRFKFGTPSSAVLSPASFKLVGEIPTQSQ